MEKKKPDLSERCFKDMLDVYSDCEDADKVDVVWSIDHICHEIRNHPDRAIGALTQLKLHLIKDLEENGVCPNCGEQLQAVRDKSKDQPQPYGEDFVVEEGWTVCCPHCGYTVEDDEL